MENYASNFGTVRWHQVIPAKNRDIGPSTRPKLLAFFDDSQKLNHLKTELAAVVDWGEVSIKATYKLEGDGPLALTCYETIQEVKSAIQVENIPNVQAIAKKISPSAAVQQQLIAYAKNCVEPALNYFKQQLTSSLKFRLLLLKHHGFSIQIPLNSLIPIHHQ